MNTSRFSMTAALLVLAVTGNHAASATTFEFDGVIDTCVPLACNLAGIGVGDPIVGYLAVDDAAAGPDSSFTAPDVLSYLIMVQSFAAGSNRATLVTADGTTDAQGELVEGFIEVAGSAPVGDGEVSLVVTIDVTASTWEASTDFLNLGTVATGAIGFTLGILGPDSDADGVGNRFDNCLDVANTLQQDTNNDSYGNICDADLDDDLQINFLDLGIMKSVFFSNDEDADLTSDNVVNFFDLGVMKGSFFGKPGASGLVPDITFTFDVQPIFMNKCTPCHTGLGFGGHNIGSTYADALQPAGHPACTGLTVGECSIVRIQSGDMPNGAGCTGDPAQDQANAACLTQAEQDTVQQWINFGLPQ